MTEIPAHIWRQILSECTNRMAVEILHLPPKQIKLQREAHGIDYPWPDATPFWQSCTLEIARERWSGGLENPPDPISEVDLAAQIKARVANRKGGAKSTPKPTHLAPEAVIRTIQSLEDAGAPPPTDDDLASILDCNPRLIYNILFHRRHLVIRDEQTDTYRMRPPMQTTPIKISPQDFLAQYGPPPKEQADQMQERAGAKATEPETEVNAEMVGRPPAYNWPDDLVSRYDTLRAEGKDAVAILCAEIGCPRASLDSRISVARKKLRSVLADQMAQERAASDALQAEGPVTFERFLVAEQERQLIDLLGTAWLDWIVVPVPETEKYMARRKDQPKESYTGTWEEMVAMLKSRVEPAGVDVAEAGEAHTASTEPGLFKKAHPCYTLVLMDSGSARDVLAQDQPGRPIPRRRGHQWPECIEEGDEITVRVWQCLYVTGNVRVMIPAGSVLKLEGVA